MSDVIFLHNATAYNAATDALKGVEILVGNFSKVQLWFSPSGSYNGTANFEMSPDSGTNWYPVGANISGSTASPVNTVATPTGANLYIVTVPTSVLFRVRMSGGSQGALTVLARGANGYALGSGGGGGGGGGDVNVTNFPATQNVAVTNTPTVNIAAAQTVAAVTAITNPVPISYNSALVAPANPLGVGIIGTPNVAVTNTPSVTVSGTPNVAVTNTPTVNIAAAQTLANVTTLATVTNPVPISYNSALVAPANPLGVGIIGTPTVNIAASQTLGTLTTLVNIQNPVSVRAATGAYERLTFTPTVSTGAYAVNDAIGGKGTLTYNAAFFKGLIRSILFDDVTASTRPSLQIYLFSTDPTTSTITNDALLVVPNADRVRILYSYIIQSGDMLADGGIAGSYNLHTPAMPIVFGANIVYVAIKTLTAGTFYAGASDVRLTLNVERSS